FRVGGAQAVAAFAFGTATVPAVSKIVGPGNAFVAAAKRQVRGMVEIEQEAGPSEVVVLADDSADAMWVAADLLAQAEHGSGDETAVLVTPSEALAAEVRRAMAAGLGSVSNAAAARRALGRNGAVVLVRGLDEGIAAVNELAPEHAQLMTRRAAELAPRIVAGAVFVGKSAEDAGMERTKRAASAAKVDPLRHIKPSVRSIAAYTLAAREAAVKLNQNENPYDLPEAVKRRVLDHALARPWSRYPEFDPKELVERLAGFAGWRPDGILAGHGSHELIEALLVVDEAYHEFAGQTVVPLLARHPNLVVLRTFSKAMGLAGLRIGYLLASPEIVREVNKARLPYNVNFFSQAAALAALDEWEV